MVLSSVWHTKLSWPFWRSGLFTHLSDENLKFESGENVPGSTRDRYGLVMRGEHFKNSLFPAAHLLRMAAAGYFKIRSKPKVSWFSFL